MKDREVRFIIAGSSEEFLQWVMRRASKTYRYVYVSSVESLGVPNQFPDPKGWFVGSFNEREDISQIRQEIIRRKVEA